MFVIKLLVTLEKLVKNVMLVILMKIQLLLLFSLQLASRVQRIQTHKRSATEEVLVLEILSNSLQRQKSSPEFVTAKMVLVVIIVKLFVLLALVVERRAKFVLLLQLVQTETEFVTTKQENVFAKKDFMETIVLQRIALSEATERFALEMEIATCRMQRANVSLMKQQLEFGTDLRANLVTSITLEVKATVAKRNAPSTRRFLL